ncbi:HNH endonuclease [Sorangium sp. So ce1153]|uniref:HNH endonuclease n=1 Tax=Sorangium sp. So ce1153 TaxID=3133333 RepID=UPI003F631E8F
MDTSLVALVTQRAKAVCEYCQLPQPLSSIPFEIDHIIAQKHGGVTVPENLGFACFYCNSYKGPNIAGIDPESGRIVRLYHPRKDRWSKHFAGMDHSSWAVPPSDAPPLLCLRSTTPTRSRYERHLSKKGCSRGRRERFGPRQRHHPAGRRRGLVAARLHERRCPPAIEREVSWK